MPEAVSSPVQVPVAGGTLAWDLRRPPEVLEGTIGPGWATLAAGVAR